MSRIRSAILASLAADSLSLGAHWEYDQTRIARQLGRVADLLPPTLNDYHTGKGAGAQSHYGDQALLLLRSVTAKGSFDLADFAARWHGLMEGGYTGYMDKASREALANFRSGRPPEQTGAATNDFAGAARMAPLLAVLGNDEEGLVNAARAQTLMTHGSPVIADGAEFMARSTAALLRGDDMRAAFDHAARTRYAALPVEDWLAFADMSLNEETPAAIARFGQSCGMQGAFLGVVHIALKHEADPATGLVDNVMAGGDSCARGLAVGMLFGARHGLGWMPERWLAPLSARAEIEAALDTLEA
ncbi:ADP-ribosylglycohydrolase family protein [Desulfovibrio sp. A2]|nr:ADP-ribosylglycohydrolase family protein [Desulfovibrio sp. A2]